MKKDYSNGDFGRQVENDCFGLPRVGAIFGLLLGLIIVVVGLQMVFGWRINFIPFAIVIIGLFFVVGAIYSYTRGRS